MVGNGQLEDICHHLLLMDICLLRADIYHLQVDICHLEVDIYLLRADICRRHRCSVDIFHYHLRSQDICQSADIVHRLMDGRMDIYLLVGIYRMDIYHQMDICLRADIFHL